VSATGWTLLTPMQARVLAVLVEKRYTVPDTYPMSLLALTAGCNQRTSRDPVMDLSEAQVQEAIDVLRPRSLVIESSGGRVMRYAENAGRVLGLPRESVALLAVLMLRGPQTAAELRAHSERLHRFSDVSSVEAYLEELASAAPEPFVVRLAVQPGSRESRWAHALCGRPAAESGLSNSPREASHERLAPASATVDASADSESLLARLHALEQRVAVLESELRQWHSGATP
jgi:uncharacterized protein YceH (UPF0502 family)